MSIDFSLVSHSAAALAYAALAILVGSKYLRRHTDRALMLAAMVSTIWATSLVGQMIWNQPPFFIRYLLELLRDAAWVAVLFALIRDSKRSGQMATKLRRVLGPAIGLLILTLLTCGALEYALGWQLLDGKTKVIGQIALSLLGVCLIEQIWRNSLSFGRSSMKYLCIGIGGIFVYDFFMYSDALLFGQLSDSFWSARGAANAFLAPLFAVNVINTRKQPVDFQLSRNAVFHAGAIAVAGAYLLFVAIGGYYVRALGGDWGEALQVLFLTIFLVLFVALLSSSRFRARLMIFISQNFFDYKYDYREEWLKMTQIFANLAEDPPLPERVVRIMADLVESNSGALWIRDEDSNYILYNTVNLTPPRHTMIDRDANIINFFKEKEWIVDLSEYQVDPIRYELLEIPDEILKFPDGWLVIPLYLGDELYGICLVGSPYAKVELNWENFDLIRVVARQTCNVLAQADAQNRLSRAMQFEAVSKASAFLVHDLKTMIAQLSLLVKNAERHRHNPEFIDDMIRTTEHAVTKLSGLVDHIRKPTINEMPVRPIELGAMLSELVHHHTRAEPNPVFHAADEQIWVRADPEQLRSVIGHLIQNAQDATSPTGEVTLNMKKSADHVVIFIQDTGAGMNEDFIKMKLFKPFESTKGLAGMGIGAYQAREYVRQIGGNIDVTSEPGLGSCFSVRLPLGKPEARRGDIDEPPQPIAENA
ncbi:PEP-CTERM system histidine kinase PrsK [Marinobacter halodurans]|uniref:histidine kinase n=1 Tax=Marinobacter halodurans TaxID=2528979 RepID=A0ABY1ZHR6_9GAMM|nr:XrtA/PEP-CTERM system histidine kinase PrsK [Marinobacter halodurans]TBW50174.1 PEP-CTERM system histidine kinase PrsK [Marinobacter halodurans]